MNITTDHKTSRNFADGVIHARHWAAIWGTFGMFSARIGPFRLGRALRKYPWMWNLLKAGDLLETMTRTRTGPYCEANALLISNITASITEMADGVITRPGITVLHEDLVPPEILYGMGLHPWMTEFLGMVVPIIGSLDMEHYIDMSENHGIPADVCSLPKSTMGVVLKGEMPQPAAVVASNMPCDGGMASYTLIERLMRAPVFRLDAPYNFHTERAVSYFVDELKRMIAWLEEHTPGRMDWDRLRGVCEERNRYVELEMELWDMLRASPAPMAAEPVYLSHMMYGIAQPGQPRATRVIKRIVELAKTNLKQGAGAIPDEKYRVILWNPPTIIFPGLFAWAEQAYGVSLIMDMLTWNRHPYIDTATPDTMLRGLARIIMEGPMARHTRGPAENFFSDLFHIHEHFNTDMIWMAGHIGCKNTQALNGMLREKCRERRIPLLIIDYDLSDTRIASPADIRSQIERFMETIMHARKNS